MELFELISTAHEHTRGSGVLAMHVFMGRVQITTLGWKGLGKRNAQKSEERGSCESRWKNEMRQDKSVWEGLTKRAFWRQVTTSSGKPLDMARRSRRAMKTVSQERHAAKGRRCCRA